MPKIFPEAGLDNLVIAVTGRGSSIPFSCIISNLLPDLELISKSQCFPLKLYAPVTDDSDDSNRNKDIYADNDEIDGKLLTAASGKQYQVTDGYNR